MEGSIIVGFGCGGVVLYAVWCTAQGRVRREVEILSEAGKIL